MSVLEVAAGLQGLDCPFLAQLDIQGTVDWVSSLLLTPGEERSGLLAWCRDRLAREETTSQAWLVSSGCCSRDSQALAFLQGSLGRRQQLQVWSCLLSLLCLEEDSELPSTAPGGFLEEVAESVSLEVQGRPEVTDVLPIALARELRGRRGLEVPPSSRAVASFLEEARGRREELARGQGGQVLEEQEEDRTRLEEAFGRMAEEMETFTVKYQGELLPWLPLSHSQPRERPEIAWAHQVVGRLEVYLEDTRAIAATASRLEACEAELRSSLSTSSLQASSLSSLHYDETALTSAAP